MPLPKAPQKPADKLSQLPPTASVAAHSPQASYSPPTRSSVQVETIAKTAPYPTTSVPTARPDMRRNVVTTAKPPAPLARPFASSSVPKQAKALAGDKKFYVLDTNVLLHDPSSLFRFDEHDVFLPMVVLEELDNHKKGTTEVARHARQVSRTLDRLVNQPDGHIATGIPLRAAESADFAGYLYFQTDIANSSVPQGLAAGVPDHLILGEVERLVKSRAPQTVVLVSKDINIRLKATVLGLSAQDYLSDNTAQDSEQLHTGWVDASTWSKSQLSSVEQWQDNGIAHIKLAE
jgi:PhoH-like ATPase